MSASSREAASGTATSAAPEIPVGPSEFFLNLLRAFIRGNGFYVLSMVLVVYGCHRHVHATVVSGAEAEFSRTLLSLTVLQAYELLIIATAALVVRRFRILSDAGTLLLIEAALLLDPTFFANSFLTMPGGRGIAVNALCLALVPLKLLLLLRLVGLRLSPRMWGGFLVAALVVYLAPWPLDRENMPFLSLYGYYYAMGVVAAVAAVLLPPVTRTLRIGHVPGIGEPGEAPDFVSAAQKIWLPRALVAFPLLIMAGHYIETSRVYTLAFFPANLAPLVLAGAALVIANGRRGADDLGRRAFVDILAAVAMLLSLRSFNVPSKTDVMRPAWALPDFIMSPWPLVVAGLGAVFVYVYLWLYLRDRAALRRLALLGAGGVGYGLWKTGVIGGALQTGMSGLRVVGLGIVAVMQTLGEGIGWALGLVGAALRWTVGIAFRYPDASLVVVLALAVWSARRFPRFGTWLVAGFFALLLLFRQFPGGATPWLVEFLLVVILMAVALSHRFRPLEERSQRLVAVALVCLVAVVRLHVWPGMWTAGFALFLIGLLLVAARLLRERGYIVLAALQLASGIFLVTQFIWLHVPPALLTVGFGLVLFAVAVYVTFNKHRLLERLQPSPAPSQPASPAESE